MAHFKNPRKLHTCNIHRGENDPIVQNGLSLTPAQMLELTRQGFSISAQNARMLSEVRPDSFARLDVPLEFRRGFDIADGYQAQQEVHRKVRDFVGKADFSAQQEGE